jgi:hypothetical protein
MDVKELGIGLAIDRDENGAHLPGKKATTAARDGAKKEGMCGVVDLVAIG